MKKLALALILVVSFGEIASAKSWVSYKGTTFETTYTQVGNAIYGSNGTSCTAIGNQLTCSKIYN